MALALSPSFGAGKTKRSEGLIQLGGQWDAGQLWEVLVSFHNES